MYAIRNKKTKKWVYGTDFRYFPHHQRTSNEQVLTYSDYTCAESDFLHRQCGNDYKIVQIKIVEVE